MKIKRNHLMVVAILFLTVLAVPLTLQGSFAESVSGETQMLSESKNVYDLNDGGIKISKEIDSSEGEEKTVVRQDEEGKVDIFDNGTTIVVYSGSLFKDAKHGIEVEPNVGEVNIQFGTNYSTEITTSGNECPFKIGAGNKVKVTTKDFVTIKSENAPGIYSEGELILDVDDEHWDIESKKSDGTQNNVFGIEAKDKLEITSSTSSGYSYSMDILGTDGAIKVADKNNIILPDPFGVRDESRPNALYQIPSKRGYLIDMNDNISRKKLLNYIFHDSGKSKYHRLRLTIVPNR